MNKKLLILLVVFLVIQIPLLFSTLTADENVYYYTAKVISEGQYTIYQDFFSAHPPLHTYILATLIKIFGLNIWILKAFTTLVTIGIACVLYKITEERYNSKSAFVTTILFLISYDILFFASFSFGLELAILFFMCSWYYSNKKPWLSGVFMGLAIATRLHVLPLALILFLHSKKRFEFIFGCSIICLPYYSYLLTIPNFINQVFSYHAGKLAHTNGWLSFLRANLILFILISYSLKNIKDTITIDFIIAYSTFMLIVGSVFEYFFLPITIILSMEGSYSLIYSKFKNVLLVVVIIWTAVMIITVVPFIYNQSQSYENYINYIKDIDGTIMGEPSFASLIALKTGKEITRNMIDLNFQRGEVFNYTNSLVIYNSKNFNGLKFNCSLINSTIIKEDIYNLWNC